MMGFLRGTPDPATPVLMPPNTHTVFSCPNVARFRFLVSANGPVFAYILDPAGLQAFRSGARAFVHGGIARSLTNHDQVVTLQVPGEYLLVVINPSEALTVALACEFHYL